MIPQTSTSKPPRLVLDNIFAFSPNRDTLGGTAYFLALEEGNIIVDSPPWDETTETFLQQQGPVRWLFLTHRGAIGKVREIQQATGCDILIQEQEAYLLPGLNVTTFEDTFSWRDRVEIFWTSGHSPGSSCLYHKILGGVLFTGRHLLPNQQGIPLPLRTAKTFHWPRQIKNVKLLLDRFTPDTLQYILPGANTGFLRGKGVIDQAYLKIQVG